MSTKVIKFQEEDAVVKFLDLAFKEKWSATSLLDDKFVLTEEQVDRIKLEGIHFIELSSSGALSHRKNFPEK